MQENNRRMPEITDPLYFVIDEKQNSIDLTDKGHDTITAAGEDPKFFILPNIGEEVVAASTFTPSFASIAWCRPSE